MTSLSLARHDFLPLTWLAVLFLSPLLVSPALSQAPTAINPPSFKPDGAVLVNGVWVKPSAEVRWSDLLRFERRETGITVAVSPRGLASGALLGQRVAILRVGGPDDIFLATQRGQQFIGEGVGRVAARRFAATRILSGPVDPDTLPLSLQVVELSPQRVMLLGRGTVRNRAVQVIFTLDEPDDGSPQSTSMVVQPLHRDPSYTLLSGDLASFYREHAAAARLYVDPMLRTLNDGVSPLRPLAGDVYTLFPFVESSPQALARLRSQLPALSSPVPGDREAALRTLLLAGDDLVLAAMRLPRAALSPEAVSRLDAFIATRTLHDPTWLSTHRDDLAMLIDCLEFPDPRVRSAAMRRIAAVTGRTLDLPDPLPDSVAPTAVTRLRRELLEP